MGLIKKIIDRRASKGGKLAGWLQRTFGSDKVEAFTKDVAKDYVDELEATLRTRRGEPITSKLIVSEAVKLARERLATSHDMPTAGYVDGVLKAALTDALHKYGQPPYMAFNSLLALARDQLK